MPADPLAREVIARTEQLVADRSTFESHFQEIRDDIRPQAAHFNRGLGTETKGAKDRVQILDNTAEDASDDFTKALHGYLTNQGQQWFSLVVRSDRACGAPLRGGLCLPAPQRMR